MATKRLLSPTSTKLRPAGEPHRIDYMQLAPATSAPFPRSRSRGRRRSNVRRELPAVPESESGPKRPAPNPVSRELLRPDLEERDEVRGPPERIDEGGSSS